MFKKNLQWTKRSNRNYKKEPNENSEIEKKVLKLKMPLTATELSSGSEMKQWWAAEQYQQFKKPWKITEENKPILSIYCSIIHFLGNSW